MGKSNIFISGLDLSTNNRGTQALGYGSLSFLKNEGIIDTNVDIISPDYYLNPAKQWRNRIVRDKIVLGGIEYNVTYRKYWKYDVLITCILHQTFGIKQSFTAFGKDLRRLKHVAAICGGDGFSDIYNSKTMYFHLHWVTLAYKLKIPHIILPQTIGPFSEESNLLYAKKILKNASKVYVRDSAFNSDLERMKVPYKECADLSYYMEKMPVDIDIKQNSIGINISGLCYFNSFRSLSGKFDSYKLLISEIVKRFQHEKTIYLIPHSYNSFEPEESGDDLEATRDFYNSLHDKTNVVLIDQDLKSPQIKYLISEMSFFIGSRMHSCFAAIFTNVKVFGLGYSYKYEYNFKKYGIPDNFTSVVDLDKNEIPYILDHIEKIYRSK